MYHFDYVTKNGGAVFENYSGGGLVMLNNKKSFSFDEFMSIFVLIENYKHPFTITTTKKRMQRLGKQLKKLGYIIVVLKQIDTGMGQENANLYGAYCVNLPNPFQY